MRIVFFASEKVRIPPLPPSPRKKILTVLPNSLDLPGTLDELQLLLSIFIYFLPLQLPCLKKDLIFFNTLFQIFLFTF